MYWRIDGEVKPLYVMDPTESEPAEIKPPPQLVPPSRRLSPLQGPEAPKFDVSDKSLDDNYTTREDMIQDVQDYTSALDLDAIDYT